MRSLVLRRSSDPSMSKRRAALRCIAMAHGSESDDVRAHPLTALRTNSETALPKSCECTPLRKFEPQNFSSCFTIAGFEDKGLTMRTDKVSWICRLAFCLAMDPDASLLLDN